MAIALSGDKSYRADWIDEYLIDLGIMPVIPSKASEDRSKRPVIFDKDRYRYRNIIERLIGWLKESCRIFSRYEKSVKNFGGMIHLGFIQRYYKTYKLAFRNRALCASLVARLSEACESLSLACGERQVAHASERRATFACQHRRTPLGGVRVVEPSVRGKAGLARLGEACDFRVSASSHASLRRASR